MANALHVSLSGGRDDFRRITDEELLRSIDWERPAPPALVRAARDGDLQAFCRELRKLPTFSDPSRGAAGREWQVLWSKHAFQNETAGDDLLALLKPAGLSRGIDQWLRKRTESPVEGTPAAPIEMLALLEILRRPEQLNDRSFWLLWRYALASAVELSRHLEEPEGSTATDDQRLLITGELPWELGLMFAPVQGARRLRDAGAHVLRKELVARTDTDGTPHAELLRRLPLWIASLVRATDWSNAVGIPLWDRRTADLLRKVIESAIVLCRPDGRLALSNGVASDPPSVLTAALELVGERGASPAMDSWRERRSALTNGSRNGAPTSARKVPLPGQQSDWAKVACLRNDWSATADALVIAHDQQLPRLELTALGRPLLSGTWELDVQVAGEPIVLDGEWDSVCWNSDEDADYLELQMTFGRRLRIERQILLSRKEHFLLLADTISGTAGGRIDYRSRVPMAEGVIPATDRGTRECRLSATKTAARVFPLALPDDRVQSTPGSFEPRSGGVELRQAAEGTGLYAPLFIDWHPKRRSALAEWRTLTVAEEARILPRDTAAGFRLRLGAWQWLIYRSLQKGRQARTVLGHHTPHETVVARFTRTGEVEPILLVE